MGLETRNETPEQPESAERNFEQGSVEKDSPELSESEMKDVDDNIDELDSQDTPEDREQKDTEEQEEDFSDVSEENPEGDSSEEIESAVETAAEDFSEPKAEVENTPPDNADEMGKHDSEKVEEEPDKEISDSDTEGDVDNKDSDSDEVRPTDEGREHIEDSSDDIVTDEESKETDKESECVEDNAEKPKSEPSSEAKETEDEKVDDSENEENEDSENEKIETDRTNSESEDVKSEESNPEETNIDYGPYTPEQIESHKGLDSIAKEYAGRELSDEDKKELSDKQYEYLKDRQLEDRDDCRVPTPESISSVNEGSDGRYRVEQNWKPGTDGAVFGSREMEVVKAGSTIDRVGSGGGNYFSPVRENEPPYSIEERATGDRMVESRLEKNSSYHQYEVKQDLTRENIESAIDSHYSGADKELMHKELNAYYDDCCDPMSDRHMDDTYSDKPVDETDGIKAGNIDHMFSDNDGGGRQYIMPFSASEMSYMELIEGKKVYC